MAATLVDRMTERRLTNTTLSDALEALTPARAAAMYHAYGNAAEANRTLAVLCGATGVSPALLARAQRMVRDAARGQSRVPRTRGICYKRDPGEGLDMTRGGALALLQGGRR